MKLLDFLIVNLKVCIMKTFKDWVLFFCVVGIVLCFIYNHILSTRIDSLESDNGNYGIVTVTEE